MSMMRPDGERTHGHGLPFPRDRTRIVFPSERISESDCFLPV
jgi:hypothetical protein